MTKITILISIIFILIFLKFQYNQNNNSSKVIFKNPKNVRLSDFSLKIYISKKKKENQR